MRRGGLAQVLQHACDPFPFSKCNLRSPPRLALAAPSSLLLSYDQGRDYNNPNNSDRFSASIAYVSSSIISDSASPSRGRALNFGGRQFGKRLTSGCSLSTNSNWRRIGPDDSSRGPFWGSIRSCLESSGRLGGAQQQGDPRRAKLVTMAASAAKGLGDGAAPEGYRPNVGLCLVNEKDEVFVASRLDIPESWQMPQGGVDKGEEPRNAAIRELREETGVTSVQLIGEVSTRWLITSFISEAYSTGRFGTAALVPEWLTYDFPPDVKTKITGLWGKEWTGQAQKWFLFRFTGDDSEIHLEGDGSEKPEFGDWKWLSANEVLKRAVEFKKPVYARAFKSLSMYIESWSKL